MKEKRMKVPIQYAIESGAWFQCKDENNDFRLKINAFEKIKLNSSTEIEKIDTGFDLRQGDFWGLKIEIISFNKQTIGGNYITHEISIVDSDDFEYQDTYDEYLCYDSHYIKSSGLKTLGIMVTFYPKIKYTGILLYFIPKDDNANYFFTLKDFVRKNI